MIGASNHFEVANRHAVMLFGLSSGAALATVGGGAYRGSSDAHASKNLPEHKVSFSVKTTYISWQYLISSAI